MKRACWIGLCLPFLGACFGVGEIVAASGSGDDMPTSTGDGDGDGDSDSVGDSGDDGGLNLDVASSDVPMELMDPVVPRTCDEAAKWPSHLGCNFFALDLDQAGLYDEDPFGVAVTNPHADVSAAVIVMQRVQDTWLKVDGPIVVNPHDHQIIELPSQDAFGSGVFDQVTYRVLADIPVAATQLSPIDGAEANSTSLARLHPTSAWTDETWILGWRTHGGVGEHAFMSILPAFDDTPINLAPSVPTVSGEGIPALQPGDQFQVSVDAGDAVQVAVTSTMQEVDEGISGSRAFTGGEHRVGVFSAHTCAGIPDYMGTCGHLQEQLSPALAGRHFVAARMPLRSAVSPEPTLWQLLAVEDDTEVYVEAPAGAVGVPDGSIYLQRGEAYALWVGGAGQRDGDLVIDSTGDLMVVGYLTNAPDVGGGGSPAMVQIPPRERWTAAHASVLPPGFEEQVLVIVRPPGTMVSIDDQLLDDSFFAPLADGHEVARVWVDEGDHRVVGSEAIATWSVGWNADDAYATLGGWGTPRPATPPEG